MNKTLLLVIGLTLGACASTKKTDCDAYGYNSRTYADTTIIWEDSRVSYIGVSSPSGLTIPKIPVHDSKQLHLNDLENGTYTITFKSENDILFTKTFTVNN
jgi:uncharacterized protein YceK